MTEFELKSLMYEETGIAMAEFEFWITASFAVLVAGYYAFSKLSPDLRTTVQRLYVIVAAVFIVRFLSSIYKMYEYNLELSSIGIDVGLQIGPATATILQTILMVIGTYAVVSFLKKMGKEHDSEHT